MCWKSAVKISQWLEPMFKSNLTSTNSSSFFFTLTKMFDCMFFCICSKQQCVNQFYICWVTVQFICQIPPLLLRKQSVSLGWAQVELHLYYCGWLRCSVLHSCFTMIGSHTSKLHPVIFMVISIDRYLRESEDEDQQVWGFSIEAEGIGGNAISEHISCHLTTVFLCT